VRAKPGPAKALVHVYARTGEGERFGSPDALLGLDLHAELPDFGPLPAECDHHVRASR
jgi:hypothetical protein